MLSFFYVRNFHNFIAYQISVDYAVIRKYFLHKKIELGNLHENVRSW
jgi:hypothetical protein